ncbi:MAG: hypothetical protein WBX22_23360 [Silvibacterium sp.]
MGTISAVTDTPITVTTTDGNPQIVALNGDTRYAKMDTAIALKDIKVGDHVVIHATKKGDQIVAATVKVGVRDMRGMEGMKMDSNATHRSRKSRSVTSLRESIYFV